MENLHDWINSGVLLILSIAFIMQNSILKYMKTAMETINPKKIKQAQEFIDEGTKHEYKIKMDLKMKEVIKESSLRFQETNKEFHDRHNELIHFIFSALIDKTWEERERHFLYYPKNAESLRYILTLYDKGEFPSPGQKAD